MIVEYNSDKLTYDIDNKRITDLDEVYKLISRSIDNRDNVYMTYKYDRKLIHLKIVKNSLNSCDECIFSCGERDRLKKVTSKFPEFGIKSCPNISCKELQYILDEDLIHLRGSVTLSKAKMILCNEDICPYYGNCDNAPICTIKLLFEEV